MNVLFIGDPHIQVSNIKEAALLITRLTELATKRTPDIIVIAGDVLHNHERVHTLALNKAYELVDRMRNISPTFVLVGNHDYIQNQQFLTTNHWMNAMKEWDNTYIVDKVIKHEQFVFVPYVPNGRFGEALQTLDADWKTAACIFAHQEFKGCKMGPIVSEDGDIWEPEFPPVISGHIHSRQHVVPNIYYPGSAMQHAFGESEINVIPMLTFAKDHVGYECEEINLDLPRKKILYIDVEDIEEFDVPDTRDELKLTVSGDFAQFKTLKKTGHYKRLITAGIKIVFKADVIEAEEGETTQDTNTSFADVLHDKVQQSEDPYLFEAYEAVVNNKTVSAKDIMFF
jgi:DNA repair exonuclease SbcCD nuclease subunit